MRFTPTIQAHDIEHKVKHIDEFLSAGEKVKVTVKFSGRQIAFPEMGVAVINNIIDKLPGVIVDKQPTMEGKNLWCILSRKQNKNAKQHKD